MNFAFPRGESCRPEFENTCLGIADPFKRNVFSLFFPDSENPDIGVKKIILNDFAIMNAVRPLRFTGLKCVGPRCMSQDEGRAALEGARQRFVGGRVSAGKYNLGRAAKYLRTRLPHRAVSI